MKKPRKKQPHVEFWNALLGDQALPLLEQAQKDAALMRSGVDLPTK